MRMRLRLLLSLALSCCVFAAGPRQVIVFADVTPSLRPNDEAKQVGELILQMTELLTPGTQLEIYPLHRNSQNPRLLFTNRMDALLTDKEKADIIGKLDTLYRTLNSSPREPEKRTCILNALQFAKSRQEPKGRTDVVIVSDMMEDCQNTPFRRPVSLTSDKQVDEEIKFLRQKAETWKKSDRPIDVSGLNFFFLLPAQSQNAPESRPRIDGLRQYWLELLPILGAGPKIEWNQGSPKSGMFDIR